MLYLNRALTSYDHAKDDNATFTWDYTQELMVKLSVLIIVILGCGKLATHCRNSKLIGYVIGGILCGPQVMNIVPHAFIETFTVAGRIGVCLLILEAGIDMDINIVRKKFHAAVGLTVLSMIMPVLLIMGLTLAIDIGSDLKVGFAMGSCFAATSVGMSAKLLRDYDVKNEPFATLIVTVAMIDDILSLVLLSVVTQLGGDIKVVNVVMPIVGALGFTVILGLFAVRVNPYIVDYLRDYTGIKESPDSLTIETHDLSGTPPASPPTPFTVPGGLSTPMRSLVHEEAEESVEKDLDQAMASFDRLGSYWLSIIAVVFGSATATLSSELLGVFFAGMAFCKEPEVHRWWHVRIEKVASLGSIIFFASLGFEVPISDMLTGKSFGFGLLFVLPAVIGKVVPAFILYDCTVEGLVIGEGLACWGEIAFLMAKVSYDNEVFGEYGSKDAREVLSILIWALLIGTCLMPAIFPLLLQKIKLSSKPAKDGDGNNYDNNRLRRNNHSHNCLEKNDIKFLTSPDVVA